jgi:hypothetical protein
VAEARVGHVIAWHVEGDQGALDFRRCWEPAGMEQRPEYPVADLGVEDGDAEARMQGAVVDTAGFPAHGQLGRARREKGMTCHVRPDGFCV